MPQDPTLIEVDEQGLEEAANATLDYATQVQKQREATAQAQEQTEAEETQAVAEQKDPREADQWGFKALVKEGQSILSGG